MGFAAAQSSLSIAASESLLPSATSASGSLSTGVSNQISSPNTPSGMVNTHIVQVGGPNGSLSFYPNNVQARPGDLVQFQFHPKNHSVVRSTFDQPCIPMGNIQANATNTFFSGFMPTNSSFGTNSNVLTYTIRVMDTKPIWYYCSQARHCQNGMVGAINAPTSGNKTMQAFTALAALATEYLSPGQAPGSGTGNTPPSPSGGSGGSGGNGGGSGGGSNTGPNSPQQSTNSAPALNGQSFFGLAAAALVAFLVL